MFQKVAIAIAMSAGLFIGVTARAEDAPAAPAAAASAPASPHTLTGNIGVYSQYIFRGLTQTDTKPAYQGGFDYSYNFGSVTAYAGTWGSNINWLVDSGQYQSSGLESDWYGGARGNFGETDFSYDVGFLEYYYPGRVASGGQKGDTQEVYGQLGWKWLTGKVSYSVGDSIFGVRKSRGTYYLDLSANYPIGETGLTAIAHYGDQKYTGTDDRSTASNDSLYTYQDWKLGVSYDASKLTPVLGNVTVGIYFTGTNAKASGYTLLGKNIGKSATTVFIQKTL